MGKLLKCTKEAIVHKFLDYTFAARKKEINETEHKLAREYYESVYDEPTRIKMNALPQGWLDETDRFYVNAGGYQLRLNFPENVKVRIFATHDNSYYSGSTKSNIKNLELIQKMQKWANSEATLKEDRNNFRHKMNSFLTNISTEKAFLDAMPDAKDILGVNFFGQPPTPTNALVTTAAEIMCVVAKERQEDRAGCYNGKLVATNKKVAKAK